MKDQFRSIKKKIKEFCLFVIKFLEACITIIVNNAIIDNKHLFKKTIIFYASRHFQVKKMIITIVNLKYMPKYDNGTEFLYFFIFFIDN